MRSTPSCSLTRDHSLLRPLRRMETSQIPKSGVISLDSMVLTGDRRVLSTPSRTRDSADLAGPSQPPLPLSPATPLPPETSSSSLSSSLSTAILNLRVATVDGKHGLSSTLRPTHLPLRATMLTLLSKTPARTQPSRELLEFLPTRRSGSTSRTHS